MGKGNHFTFEITTDHKHLEEAKSFSYEPISGCYGNKLSGQYNHKGAIQSCIIDPQGRVIAGPLEGEEILIADCYEERILLAKAECDVAGHYSRPDVFQLRVNRAPHRRVVEAQEPNSETTEFETVSDE
jgi:hypothetical protein